MRISRAILKRSSTTTPCCRLSNKMRKIMQLFNITTTTKHTISNRPNNKCDYSIAEIPPPPPPRRHRNRATAQNLPQRFVQFALYIELVRNMHLWTIIVWLDGVHNSPPLLLLSSRRCKHTLFEVMPLISLEEDQDSTLRPPTWRDWR